MNLFEAVTGKVTRMSNVTRYSSFPTIRKENVAEHSWWVAFIGYLIAEDMRIAGFQIDLADVLRKAIVHDLSECMSGDIIRSYKHTNTRVLDAMEEADEEHMELMVKEFGSVDDVCFDDWMTSKSDKIEGEIVRFADMATVIFYCRTERQLGNAGIDVVLKEVYESWFHKFHDHPDLKVYADQMFPYRHWSDPYMGLNLRFTEHVKTRPLLGDHSEGPVSPLGIDGGPIKGVPLS